MSPPPPPTKKRGCTLVSIRPLTLRRPWQASKSSLSRTPSFFISLFPSPSPLLIYSSTTLTSLWQPPKSLCPSSFTSSPYLPLFLSPVLPPPCCVNSSPIQNDTRAYLTMPPTNRSGLWFWHSKPY